jgi:beta-xylosidase
MTKEEIGELVAALPEGLDADEFIYKLVNWAVDREREACAKVCEEWGAWNNTAQDCAQAIRGRSEK